MGRRSGKTHLFIPTLILVTLTLVVINNPFNYPNERYKSFTPPQWYEAIWNLTWEQCTSRYRTIPSFSFRDIKWYKVDAPHFNTRPRGDSILAVVGLTNRNQVFLSRDHINDVKLVSHEMMHAQGIHIGAYKPHPPIFEECYACIQSVIRNTARGNPAPCIGN